jgi:hypothetical protein
MSASCSRHQVMETLSALQARLTASKRLLFALFECPDFDCDELHDLGSTAIMAERLVDDLSRAIDLRCGISGFEGLDLHELQVLRTALLVDDAIDFAIGRLAAPASGATAIH